MSDEFDRLLSEGRVDEASRKLEEMLPSLHADDADCKRLVILSYSGRYEEAYQLGHELLARGMTNPMLRFCLARLAISIGKWQEGIAALDECRNFGFFGGPYLTRERPLWSGEPLAGRTLLLLSEGRLGDIVCFARFVRDFEKLGANVILVADRAMFPILKSLVRRGALLSPEAALQSEFDFWLPALSAPRLLRLEPGSLDSRPYVHPPEEVVQPWRKEVAFEGLKIGLITSGSPQFAKDRFRSIPEEEWLPLLHGLEPGARLFTIHPSRIGIPSFASMITDPIRLAGFLSAMDVVVSVDTGPAHLAGALGLPTILLNRVFGWPTFAFNAQPGSFLPSPWYQSMRVLQQKKLMAWREEVLFVRDLLNSSSERDGFFAETKRRSQDSSSTLYHPLAPAPSPEKVKLVDTVDGPLLTLPNDFYVGRSLEIYGEYSRLEADVILEHLKPGDHVIEAGAHLGAHAVTMARRVGPQGRVWAFEPQEFLRQITAANLGLQGLSWVEVRGEARPYRMRPAKSVCRFWIMAASATSAGSSWLRAVK